MIANARETFYKWIVIALVLAIILAVLTGCERDRRNEPQLLCAVNESPLRKADGWKQLSEIDRQRVGRLVGLGRAEIEYRPGSLICTFWKGNHEVITISNAGLWYWRTKQ